MLQLGGSEVTMVHRYTQLQLCTSGLFKIGEIVRHVTMSLTIKAIIACEVEQ